MILAAEVVDKWWTVQNGRELHNHFVFLLLSNLSVPKYWHAITECYMIILRLCTVLMFLKAFYLTSSTLIISIITIIIHHSVFLDVHNIFKVCLG